MSWAGCQNHLINVNFQLQKSFKVFEKISWQSLIQGEQEGITMSPHLLCQIGLIIEMIDKNVYKQKFKFSRKIQIQKTEKNENLEEIQNVTAIE